MNKPLLNVRDLYTKFVAARSTCKRVRTFTLVCLRLHQIFFFSAVSSCCFDSICAFRLSFVRSVKMEGTRNAMCVMGNLLFYFVMYFFFSLVVPILILIPNLIIIFMSCLRKTDQQKEWFEYDLLINLFDGSCWWRWCEQDDGACVLCRRSVKVIITDNIIKFVIPNILTPDLKTTTHAKCGRGREKKKNPAASQTAYVFSICLTLEWRKKKAHVKCFFFLLHFKISW